MNWCPSDPPSHVEKTIRKRDGAALYDALGAIYLSPSNGFDELAPTYDQRLAGNPLFGLESRAIFSLMPDLAGESVADIGCGTGRLALQIARMGASNVIGVDLSAQMLAVASRKTVRSGDLADIIGWKQGDILERLPLPDASFPVVVCALTLSFVQNVGGAFRELSRIIAPGGYLIISDYHPHGLTQARAEAVLQNSNKERAPYLRFTSASGDDCRIAQSVHTMSDLVQAGQEAGLVLNELLEPIPDRHVSNTYPGLRDRSGIPIAIIARFGK